MAEGAVIIDDGSGGVDLRGHTIRVGNSVAFALLSGTRLSGLASNSATATVLNKRMTELAAGPVDIDHNTSVLLRAASVSSLVITSEGRQKLTLLQQGSTIRIDASIPMREAMFVLGDASLFYYYILPNSGPITRLDVNDDGLDRPSGVNSLGVFMELL